MTSKLPDVDRIQGLRHQGPAHLREGKVIVQYTDAGEEWHDLNMSLGDAMYLLSLLKSLQLNLGLPFPDDPRHPDDRSPGT